MLTSINPLSGSAKPNRCSRDPASKAAAPWRRRGEPQERVPDRRDNPLLTGTCDRIAGVSPISCREWSHPVESRIPGSSVRVRSRPQGRARFRSQELVQGAGTQGGSSEIGCDDVRFPVQVHSDSLSRTAGRGAGQEKGHCTLLRCAFRVPTARLIPRAKETREERWHYRFESGGQGPFG